MFSVVRRWQIKADPSILKLYFKEFRANFKQSLFIELIWLTVLVILYFDFTFILQLESNFKVIGFGIFFTISFLFICTTAFIFPLLVNYQVSWKHAILNSFILSMVYFPTTLTVIVLTLMFAAIVYVIPLAALIIYSLAAYTNYALCNRKFKKINLIKGFTKSNTIDNESEIV